LSFTAQEAAYNAFFTTQWGPTLFNAANGIPDGDKDCGPTSLVMALSALGVYARPTPDTAETQIIYTRAITRGNRPPLLGPVYGPMLRKGLASLGWSSRELGADVAAVREASREGRIVLVAGDPGNAWGRKLDAAAHYLHHYRGTAADRFGHWVVLFEREAQTGRYVLGDPLSTQGVITVDDAQLATYFADGDLVNGGISGAISIDGPSAAP
jgi:hypothetical protein